MISKSKLMQQLQDLGLKAGMDVLVHSSLRRVGKVEGGADTIIDSLLEILGPQGTLLMSTVSGNVNPTQPVFHVTQTPATVGTLPNIFRLRPGAVRSLHPVHSVVAMGPKSGILYRRASAGKHPLVTRQPIREADAAKRTYLVPGHKFHLQYLHPCPGNRSPCPGTAYSHDHNFAYLRLSGPVA